MGYEPRDWWDYDYEREPNPDPDQWFDDILNSNLIAQYRFLQLIEYIEQVIREMKAGVRRRRWTFEQIEDALQMFNERLWEDCHSFDDKDKDDE
jgi:hypothetical protein